LLVKKGIYLLHVTVNDYHVGGSPFELKISRKTDPSKVLFNIDEVKTGILGQDLNTLIDTSEAGPGELTVSCVGSQKAAICKLEDRKNGIFMLKITPHEIGKHLLQIKYNNQQITNSPFQIRIFSPPDATKVKK
jgi:filamin